MFCCTKREDHEGEIVNSICLEEECVKNRNQLSCPVCIQEEHQGHTLTTMKKILPELLTCHKEKERQTHLLKNLFDFITENFGDENSKGENVTLENSVNRAIEVLIELKNQVEANNQEICKMKDIFKNLNKNANQSSIPITKSTIGHSEFQAEEKYSSQKSSIQNSPTKISRLNNFNSPIKSIQKNGFESYGGAIDIFSHTLKHPYLSLSSDYHTATKSSNSGTFKFIEGHRFAVLNSKSLSYEENEVNVKIDVSHSGNIMIGLCHESIVKEKDLINNYGINHGTYLIGQNGNNPETAISFHHSSNIFNRKEMIGWNFKQGETVAIGFNFNEQYIYFKINKEKGKTLEFDMALFSEDYGNKQSILNLLAGQGLKVIVLLQNVGDQVTLIEA